MNETSKQLERLKDSIRGFFIALARYLWASGTLERVGVILWEFLVALLKRMRLSR